MNHPRGGWSEIGDADSVRKFAYALAEAVKGNDNACPFCKSPNLRFVYHKWKGPSYRGTLWGWCNNCLTWRHISGYTLPLNSTYHTGLTDELFQGLPALMLERLDKLWENGEIPRKIGA